MKKGLVAISRFVSVAVLSALLLLPGRGVAGPNIHLLLSERSGIYQEVADNIVEEIGRNKPDWTITIQTLGRYSAKDADLTVAIGTKALEEVVDVAGGKPVLALLVPKSTYGRLINGQKQISALYLDQPIARQMRLLKTALPGLRKVGVPLGPVSKGLQGSLLSESQQSDIEAGSAIVSKELDLLSVLSALAEDSQAFLLLPDPVVVQRSSLQPLFLHTYRLRKPVLAYSASLVQSGALLGLYVTPAQVGKEAASWIGESWSRGGFRIGPPRYPRQFTIGVNWNVARSLEIDVPSEAELYRKLETME